MLHLTRIIDKATGCVFVPPPTAPLPKGAVNNAGASPTQRPNAWGLMSSAMGIVKGPRSDVRDVQERWIDAKEDWDVYEKVQWRREGQLVKEEEARRKAGIRERVAPTEQQKA